MKGKLTIRIITVLCLVVTVLSSVGVYATWHYAQGTAQEVSTKLTAGLGTLVWEGSEALPDDVQGENHHALIQTILNGVTEDGVSLGLNDPNSYLSKEIDTRSSNWLFSSTTLGSMDYWERADIEKYFDLETENLTFLLYFPEGVDDTYYLYTMNIELGGQNAPNIPIGEYVYPVYRTILQKDSVSGRYEAIRSEIGYAESAYYSNPITGSIFVKYPSIAPNSWLAGNLGTGKRDAIYTYLGETQTAYPTNDTPTRYYKITATSNATYAVTSTNEKCTISVYTSNDVRLVTSTGTTPAQWSATNRQTYYITVGGDASVTFTVAQV